jgi:two-component system, NtrC family, nitrogen regulation response regulator GlnG
MNELEGLSGAESAPTVKIAPPGARRHGWLLEIQDEGEVKRVPIHGTLRIGSRKGADVIVDDETVSAIHVEARSLPDGVIFRDLQSTNGMWAGGARVTELWAGEGTTIIVGQTTIVVRPTNELEDDEVLEPPLTEMAGGSLPMRRIASVVRRLAKLSAPVLIAGPTGAGKELVARALHLEGPRKAAQFVAMNVAALPRELVETELFGHERGAFTGAVQKRAGAFAEADGGTLFLDEIGELAVEAQPKLLRALDGYEVRRIGAAGNGRRPDARVIAATHVPLLERVVAGRFRRDLFHRLEVFVIEIPPLHARRSDILAIAKHLFEEAEHEIGPRCLTPAATAVLMTYEWPGNVRELRNVLLRAADLSGTRRWIEAAAVERALRNAAVGGLTLTREQAKEWLVLHEGNTSAAARAAGVPRTTFRKLLNRPASDDKADSERIGSRADEDE